MSDSLPPQLLQPVRTGRQPVTGHNDPGGDLRVFAIQYRIDMRDAESIESYRDSMRRLMDELVVPHLVPGRPTLVVYPEAVGLPAVAIGWLDSSKSNATLLDAAVGIAAQSADCIDAYLARFGEFDMRTAIYLAATDTMARAFSQTFSDIARDYGVWVVAGNYQAPFIETHDQEEIVKFGTPEHAVAYVATTSRVTNSTFLWGPDDVNIDAPLGERNLLARNEKTPLTEMELELLGLAEGPAEGEAGRQNAGWTDVAGFRVGFATSLPAFMYGYPFGERPPGFDPFADLRSSYAAAQDALDVDVMIQPDANAGPWATLVPSGAWQPLEWMSSVWRAVADPTVRFRYNVTPMMTGNLFDLVFDGQSSITGRGHVGPGMRFVGNSKLGPNDPAEYGIYTGDKGEFLAVSPWLVPDAPREQLLALTAAVSPGSGSSLENGYIETAIFADLRKE